MDKSGADESFRMRDFYVNVSSFDSLNHFPSNAGDSFTVKFPVELHMSGASWMCALVDISHPALVTPVRMLTLYCDAVRDTIIDGKLCKILRRFPNRRFDGVAYSSPQYIKVKSERLTQMSFMLKGDNNSSVDFEKGETYITLHFILES